MRKEVIIINNNNDDTTSHMGIGSNFTNYNFIIKPYIFDKDHARGVNIKLFFESQVV